MEVAPKKLLTIGASSSQNSINRKLANYVAHQVQGAVANLLDLNDYEMPIYSIDREKSQGIPALANQFKQQIVESDGIVLSLAEHNGSYATIFKNIIDWGSRIEGKLWEEKPLFLLATSPGGRGAKTVFEAFQAYWPKKGANVVAAFSLPGFHQNFSAEEGILEPALKVTFLEQLAQFEAAITKATVA
ncbi:MAG TPA: NADPH-dependent FMN reductase [Microscillaceae bacterium]|nr:NADPH-dependent FMN reductase [Microscillaceae bacterium]